MKYNKQFEFRIIDHRTKTVIKGMGKTMKEAEAAANKLMAEKYGNRKRWF